MVMKLISHKVFQEALNYSGPTKRGMELEKLLKNKLFKRIPYKFVDLKDKVGWLGSERCLLIRKEDEGLHVLHEFCHYLLCSKDRLAYDEFGLGRGFRSNAMDAKRVLNDATAYQEEEAVCLLAASFMLHMRMGKGIVGYQLQDQNFDGYDKSFFKKSIRFIRNRKKTINKKLGMDLL